MCRRYRHNHLGTAKHASENEHGKRQKHHGSEDRLLGHINRDLLPRRLPIRYLTPIPLDRTDKSKGWSTRSHRRLRCSKNRCKRGGKFSPTHNRRVSTPHSDSDRSSAATRSSFARANAVRTPVRAASTV